METNLASGFVSSLVPSDVYLGRYTFFCALFTTAEAVVTYPHALLKTRLQVHTADSSLIRSYVREIQHLYRSYGWRGFYRGWLCYTGTMFPVDLIYISTYTVLKRKLQAVSEDQPALRTLAPFVAGAAAELTSMSLWMPQDIITQNVQVQSSNGSRLSAMQVASLIWRKEGIQGFYRATPASLWVCGTFSAFWWGCYEIAKTVLVKNTRSAESGNRICSEDQDQEILSLGHCTSGAIAGVVVSITTNPLDVAKTRLQTKLSCYGAQTLPTIISRIIAHEGTTALTRGLLPRILTTAPQSAISALSYECILHFSNSPT